MKQYLASHCPRCHQPVQVLNPAWLRARRQTLGLTLADIAGRLGCSVVYVHLLETGKKRVGGPVGARVPAAYEANA